MSGPETKIRNLLVYVRGASRDGRLSKGVIRMQDSVVPTDFIGHCYRIRDAACARVRIRLWVM